MRIILALYWKVVTITENLLFSYKLPTIITWAISINLSYKLPTNTSSHGQSLLTYVGCIGNALCLSSEKNYDAFVLIYCKNCHLGSAA